MRGVAAAVGPLRVSQSLLIVAVFCLCARAELKPHVLATWVPASPNDYAVPAHTAVSPQGDVYTVGWTEGSLDSVPRVSPTHDGYIRKLKQTFSGAVDRLLHEWTWTYGPGPNSASNRAFFRGVTVDDDGTVYACGWIDGDAFAKHTDYDMVIVSLFANGTENWIRQYNDSAALDVTYQFSTCPIKYHNGRLNLWVENPGLYMSIVSLDASNGDEIWDVPVLASRLISGRNILSTSEYSGTWMFDSSELLAIDSAGSTVAVGNTRGDFAPQFGDDGHVFFESNSNADVVAIKLDAAGGVQWRWFSTSPCWESAATVHVDAAGDVFVGGGAYCSINGEVAHDVGYYDSFLVKLDGATGAVVWTRQWPSCVNVHDWVSGVGSSASGDLYVTSNCYNQNGYLIRFDMDGNRKYSTRFSGDQTRPQSLVLDANDVLHVTGRWYANLPPVSSGGNDHHGFVYTFKDARNCTCDQFDDAVDLIRTRMNMQLAASA